MRVVSFIFLALFFVTGATSFAGEKQRDWEQATVISQGLDSQSAGAYAAPIGNATIAVPLYKRSNTVVVETDHYKYQWSEVGRNLIILPVNGKIQFYRDGNWFIVMDSKNKKHKFALVGEIVK